MLRSILTCSSAVALAAGLAAGPSPVAAQDARMCNPVVDSSGNPVHEAAGGVVTHSDSFPCPPEEEDVAIVEEEEVVTEVRPAAGVDLPEEETVYFAFDVAELEPEAASRLEQLVGTIQTSGGDVAGVTVAGHADRAGPAEYNVSLSDRRAQNVAAELVKGGIPARVIQTEAFGESRPAVETGDGVALQANRRAVIDLSY